MADLSETLRAARKERGWSQMELAKRSGLSQTTISDIERGRNRTSRDLIQIARALDISVEQLTSGITYGSVSATKVLTIKEPQTSFRLEQDEQLLLDAYRTADETGRMMLITQARALLAIAVEKRAI